MLKRLFLFVTFFIFLILPRGFSQITIHTVDPGPYTPGSTITALFNLGSATCLKPGNAFGLWLSDANGSFATESLLDAYSGFYGTFVNGRIPSGISPGTNYRLRIKSGPTNIIISDPSAPFEIKAGSAAEAKLTSMLIDSSNPEVFGFCSGRTNQTFNFTNESTAGSSVTASLTNELTGGAPTDIIFDTQIKSFVPDLAHYTIFVKAKAADGTVATAAYLLVNNKALTTFSTQGANSVCLPGGSLEFLVDIDGPNGIKNNFPGNIYRVSWGDNSEDLFTLCDIHNNNSKITHVYTTSSCGQTFRSGAITEFNAFGINISAENSFCGRVGTAISTTAKVVTKPENNFTFNRNSCLNSSINFTNTSDVGQDPNTTSAACAPNNVTYTWFVDGNPIAADKNKAFVFNYVFTTPGEHTIRLESNSSTAICPADPIVKTICIQAPPQPSFSLNGSTSGVTLCAPSTLKPTNTSIVDNNCSNNEYLWTITGPGTVATVNNTNRNSPQPEFRFTTGGTYKLKLSVVTPSCGTFETPEQTIIVDTPPVATLSPDITVCNLTSYDFFDNTNDPTKTILTGTEVPSNSTYKWTITGGRFAFAQGFTASSRFPSIVFRDYAAYTVTVTHTNQCGTASDSQLITFKQSPTVDAGTYSAICYNDNISLQGAISEPVVSYEWTGGGGIFSDKNNLNTLYTPTAAERAAGFADLTLTATTALTPPCNKIPDAVRITIKPRNALTSSAEKRICTGTRVGYNPLSTVSGSTFTWEVVSNTADASGFATTGSGTLINDLLSNSSATTNASVTYRITPSANGCIGEPFDFTAIVTPAPIASPLAASATICSGQSAAVALHANIPDTRFLWRTTASANINGYSDNVAIPATSLEINDILINNGTTPGTVTYEVTPVSENGCYGAPVPITITVNPSATVANAGPDESLCSQTTYTFNASLPLVGAGKWTQIAGPTSGVSFADDTKNNTTVSGLQDGMTYTFRWTISTTNNCSTSQDDVILTVNRPTNGGITSGSVTVCSGNNGGQITLSGNEGNVIRWESSVDNGQNWLPIAETGMTYAYSNLTATTQFRAVVQSGICLPATSAATTITVSPPTVVANAGPAQTLCDASSFTLTGNNPAPNTGFWTKVSGPAGAVITTPNANVTTVTGVLSGQTYQFTWTITGTAPCPPSPATVTINNLAPLQNTISTGSPTVCSGQTILVSGSDPTGGNGSYSYIWQSSADGNTWTTINGQTNRDLNIVLTATLSFRRTVISNACSLTSTAVLVNALPPLSNNVISATQTICAGKTPLPLTGSTPVGGDGIYNYKWQMSTNGTVWDDLTGGNEKDFSPPALTVTTSYRRVVSTQACTGPLESTSNAIRITVNPNAKAEFTFQTDASCPPFFIDAQNVKATPYADRNAVYTWYANDVEIGRGINFPGYRIETAGEQVSIKLVVTSSLGCSEDESPAHIFSTPATIQAQFTMDKTEGCGPMAVNFTSQSVVPPGASFKWNFGNGQESTSETPPPITFLPDPLGDDKTYDVSLVVTTACGTSTPFPGKVLVRAATRSVFAPDKTVVCSPMNVNFRNNSPDASNTTYTFDYGDGTAPDQRGTDKSTRPHQFPIIDEIRTYHVKMTAIGPCGPPVITTHDIKVLPNKVIADMVVDGGKEKGCAPYTVTFYNRSKGADSFEFDFDDGSQKVTRGFPLESITHTFEKEGHYNVKMIASNGGCSFDGTIEPIEVLPQPKADFTAALTEGCPGLVVEFTNHSENAFSYTWDFGDGSGPSFDVSPKHEFKGDKPYYTVTMTATSSLGCPTSVTKTNFIHILQPPVAAFNVEPGLETEIPNYTFRFSDASSNSPDGWLWDFGDNTTSTEKNPRHTYDDVGAYVVTLTVKNQTGCSSSAVFKTVKITGVPGYLQLPNSFIPGNELTEFRLFKAKGTGLKSWKFSVFDKWGEVLWETTKLDGDGKPTEGWDGTFKGKAMPQGVYFWKADVQFINGSEWKGMSYGSSAPKRTGIIHLIR